MADSTKDIIYIDVDEEITGIIDKVATTKHKIVALVLPKRAAVLQSIVNMKLLKRTGVETKKHIVLITSETGLLPLAGAVGMHVAKTPQSKPYIPSPPDTPDAGEAVISAANLEEVEPNLDESRPVGELAGLPPAEEDETIEVDNSDKPPAGTAGTAAARTKKSKKFNIPNFDRFRKRFLLGIAALILLIVGLILFSIVLPKAKITVKTDTTAIANTVDFTASTSAEEFNPADNVLPAELEELTKTEAEKVPATGEKDAGTKATGTVTFINCTDEGVTIPAGTGVSSDNLNFITQAGIDLDEGDFTSNAECKSEGDHVGNTKVTAQNNGDQYNLDSRSYEVAGVSGDIRAQGSQMSGGTTKIVKVVTDQDIATARSRIGDRATDGAVKELTGSLEQAGLLALNETLTTGEPNITASPTVGQEATEVTVTAITTYSMLGVKQENLKTLLEEAARKELGEDTQTIQDDGLSEAVFQVLDKQSPGEVNLSMQAQTIAGPVLDTESLKKEVAGKKRGEVQSIISSHPGVSDVTVDYSPFWVLSTPGRAGNITIIVEQSDDGSAE